MATVTRSVSDVCLAARDAAQVLAALDTDTKNAALQAIAGALVAQTDAILDANARDMEAGRANGLDAALLDRLALDPERIAQMAAGTRAIAALPDPAGEIVEGRRLPNGLDVRKLRVPFGVVAV
ncbi:MAG TPA: gamma-glutamyl-phosphate reductase, partial [Solirubrobacteraceae bacterium]|nr:gamma-glutamyl-phosphate reductase [Solirubrobacteraceae bacterium]